MTQNDTRQYLSAIQEATDELTAIDAKIEELKKRKAEVKAYIDGEKENIKTLLSAMVKTRKRRSKKNTDVTPAEGTASEASETDAAEAGSTETAEADSKRSKRHSKA